jgi:3-hydroxybutyryl-CoA dehydratase
MVPTNTIVALPALAVGMRASFTKNFQQIDSVVFADISGDANPLHLDPDYAASTRFGQPIAHGLLVAGLISAVLGKQLPGPGAIYLGQTLRFLAPVHFGDTITATVEVVAVRPDKPIVTLHTTCVNQRGETVIDGEATVMVPDLGAAARPLASLLN